MSVANIFNNEKNGINTTGGDFVIPQMEIENIKPVLFPINTKVGFSGDMEMKGVIDWAGEGASNLELRQDGIEKIYVDNCGNVVINDLSSNSFNELSKSTFEKLDSNILVNGSFENDLTDWDASFSNFLNVISYGEYRYFITDFSSNFDPDITPEYAVSISPNGNYVFVGDRTYNNNRGLTKFYKRNNDGSLSQIGQNITTTSDNLLRGSVGKILDDTIHGVPVAIDGRLGAGYITLLTYNSTTELWQSSFFTTPETQRLNNVDLVYLENLDKVICACVDRNKDQITIAQGNWNSSSNQYDLQQALQFKLVEVPLMEGLQLRIIDDDNIELLASYDFSQLGGFNNFRFRNYNISTNSITTIPNKDIGINAQLSSLNRLSYDGNTMMVVENLASLAENIIIYKWDGSSWDQTIVPLGIGDNSLISADFARETADNFVIIDNTGKVKKFEEDSSGNWNEVFLQENNFDLIDIGTTGNGDKIVVASNTNDLFRLATIMKVNNTQYNTGGGLKLLEVGDVNLKQILQTQTISGEEYQINLFFSASRDSEFPINLNVSLNNGVESQTIYNKALTSDNIYYENDTQYLLASENNFVGNIDASQIEIDVSGSNTKLYLDNFSLGKIKQVPTDTKGFRKEVNFDIGQTDFIITTDTTTDQVRFTPFQKKTYVSNNIGAGGFYYVSYNFDNITLKRTITTSAENWLCDFYLTKEK